MNTVTAARPARQGLRYRKTAFERNLLPGFAEWLVREVERWRPDFLIPAETKGARLLDTALAYARDTLGTPISVPIIYSPALPYIDPDLLRGSRVTIIDDAVCTGANLDLHRRWIASFDVADIQALVCVGLAEEEIGEHAPKRRNVDCYVNVERSIYERCIWQLAELVIARGLPPEVDHFVFEAQGSDYLAETWRELEAVLPVYGELTIDGPASKQEEMLPMSLHFPRLPPSPGHAPVPLHHDGPYKLRLFPDPAHDRFLVLPVSLPSLTLPPGVGPEETLEAKWSRRHIREAMGGEDSVADLLLDEARLLHPKTVFRALSSATEIELMRGFAQVLGEVAPGVSLKAQQEPFDRLYGPDSGKRISTLVKQEVDDALARGAEYAGTDLGELTPALETRFLDASVADTTRLIAQHLKAMYDHEDPTERLGLSMPQIAAELEISDSVLVSRCISFGLALTTLVPYIAAESREDGTFQVERFYRVSENNRGEQQPYTDIDEIQRDKSEQALALVCHQIRSVCGSYADSPIPEDLLTSLVGVLYPLVFEKHNISLCAQPGTEKLKLLLLDGVPSVLFGSRGSAYYEIVDGGVRPTETFCNLYDSGKLDLDLDGSTEDIESHVDQLSDFIEQLNPEELDRLMNCWAMSTDRRLGLEHVRKSLKSALEELRQPLKLILGNQKHDPSPGAGARARKYALAAACKLQRLSTDWSAPALDHWQRPARREQRLLGSLGAPSGNGKLVYRLPIALATVTAALGEVVENLDKASVRYWVEGDEISASGEAARNQAVGAAINWCTVIRHRLLSLDGEGDAPSASEHPLEAITEAAVALLDTVDLIDAFVAATAGDFRGKKNERRPEGVAEDKRIVSILSLDISASTSFSQLHNSETAHRWKEDVLDITAQWTRAFGSWPIGYRRGDEIRVEFDQVADAAVICAAAIKQHVAALRSTGGDDIHWRLHCGVDSGQVQDGFENVTGSCIDRACKLPKLCDGECETNNVFITREARSHCSPKLREKPIAAQQPEVLLSDKDGNKVKLRPFAIDSAAVMDLWVERLQEAGDWIAQAPLDGAGEGPLWFGPTRNGEEGEFPEAASG